MKAYSNQGKKERDFHFHTKKRRRDEWGASLGFQEFLADREGDAHTILSGSAPAELVYDHQAGVGDILEAKGRLFHLQEERG